MYPRVLMRFPLVLVSAWSLVSGQSEHNHDHEEVVTISGCHLHESDIFCISGETEYLVHDEPIVPSEYTGCFEHDGEMFCVGPDGEDVEVEIADTVTEEDHEHEHEEEGHEDHDHEQKRQEVTNIIDCHLHGSDIFCSAGGTEYLVHAEPIVPDEYTGCHEHEHTMYCMDPDGEEVEVEAVETTAEGHDHGHEEEESSGQNCHFHAGVQHCTGGEENSSEATCEAPSRDYDVGLRVGLLFVILATSAIGVFAPILLHKFMTPKFRLVIIILKQFGTGVIISTAFAHLYTHASMMFANECLGELLYESTASAILMAGIFLSFLVEYIGHRIVLSKTRASSHLSPEERKATLLSPEVVSIMVMEAGIVFHSLLIGLTLVVADDSFFLTLFTVILFHQMFEGIALGSRTATIGRPPSTRTLSQTTSSSSSASNSKNTNPATSLDPSPAFVEAGHPPSMRKKLILATIFAFITPIGMAIGIGVLNVFNGNDPSTVVAIGTLDALSAGILVWVGLVEMWAADWMAKDGELTTASLMTVVFAGTGLVSGLVLMSLLGKWA